MENTVATLLGRIRSVPGIGKLVQPALTLQQLCWNRYPGLTDRASDFLFLGGITSALQISFFFGMKKIGYSTLVASMTAVEISILFSFVASMLVTWGDRFDGFTLEQRLKITPRLLLLFNLFHPALYMMGGGIPFVERTLSVPFYAAWAICQILTVTISFIGADRVIFGKIITVVKKTE